MDILRVELEGFMSYKNSATFDFSGSNAWMLIGKNGSGKSAVFDAITYALYGKTHRDTFKGDLINRDDERALIEVDLGFGDKKYRVKRTIGKKKQSTFQVTDLDTELLVPDTESKKGLENWIDKKIGINFEAFSSSVLLAQGSADKLISAQPADRYKILTQILDLSKYQQLHERAVEKRKNLEKERDLLERQKDEISEVSEDQIYETEDLLSNCELEISELEEKLQNLIRSKANAEQYHRLIENRTKIQIELDHISQTLEDQDEIEKKFARLVELRKIFGPLKKFINDRDEHTALSRELENLRSQIETKRSRISQLETESISAKEKFENLLDLSGDLASAKTRFETAKKRFDQINQVSADEAECSFCGQPLTPDHLEKERKKRSEDRDRYSADHREKRRLNDENERLRSDLKRASEKADRDLKRAEIEIEKMRTKLGSNTRHLESLQQSIDDYRSEIPEEYHSANQQTLDDLKSEGEELSSVESKVEQLRKAKRDQQSLEDRRNMIESQIAEIPEADRRDVSEIATEERQTDRDLKSLNDQRSELLVKLRKQRDDLERRGSLETEFEDLSFQFSIAKKLAQFLGRDRLQSHLLNQMELSIVKFANEILDRVSSGTIRISLKKSIDPDDDTKEKALDLIAYNSNISEDPIPVQSLSGSQKFRVSVAIALVIGRFTANQHHGLETVIIDEGFGSLDQQGIREMVDELQNLTAILNRIIIVSHQEEIASAFTNVYEILLENGSSKVRRRL